MTICRISFSVRTRLTSLPQSLSRSSGKFHYRNSSQALFVSNNVNIGLPRKMTRLFSSTSASAATTGIHASDLNSDISANPTSIAAASNADVGVDVVSDITNVAIPSIANNTIEIVQNALVSASLQYGDLKAVGLCNLTPPGMLERLFEFMFITGSMPWWATIASSCLLIRGLLSPFTFNNFRTTALMKQIQPELKPLMEKYQTAKQVGDQERANQYMMAIAEIYRRHQVQPAGPLAGALLSAPIFVSFFISLDKLASLPIEGFKTGGLWWFQDLTVPDPYYALPAVATSIFLLNIHFGAEGGSQQSLKVKRFFQLFSIAATPFMATFPAALSFYWCVNGMASLAVGSVAKSPAFRRWWGIPDVKLHDQSPATSTTDSVSFVNIVRDSMNAGIAQSNEPVAPSRVNEGTRIVPESDAPFTATRLSSSQMLKDAMKLKGTNSDNGNPHHDFPQQQRRNFE